MWQEKKPHRAEAGKIYYSFTHPVLVVLMTAHKPTPDYNSVPKCFDTHHSKPPM